MQTEEERQNKRKIVLKKHREQYKEDMKDGRYKMRKLYFLTKTIEDMNYSLSALATKAGLSYQTLNYKIRVDDTFLTTASKLMNVMGLQLKVELKREEKTRETVESTEINIEQPVAIINAELPDVIEKGKVSRVASLLKKRREMGGMTLFITDFLIRRKVSFAEMCKTCKFDYNGTLYYLDKDDIKINMIYKIAKVYHEKVVWNITPYNSEEEIRSIPLNMIERRTARKEGGNCPFTSKEKEFCS